MPPEFSPPRKNGSHTLVPAKEPIPGWESVVRPIYHDYIEAHMPELEAATSFREQIEVLLMGNDIPQRQMARFFGCGVSSIQNQIHAIMNPPKPPGRPKGSRKLYVDV